MVRDANKIKRLEFCWKIIETNDDFDNVIFTESLLLKSNEQQRSEMFILTDLTCTVLCEHDKSVTFSHVSKFETLCKLEASQQHDCCLTVFAVLKDSK